MQRQPSCCDFCGFPVVSKEYPTDRRGINWYACADCARIIDVEDWNGLVERGVAAYAQMRSIRTTKNPYFESERNDSSKISELFDS